MRVRTQVRDLPLTELGLGTAQLGNLYRETTPEQADSAIEQAWSDGIRYFDTAPHYGLGLSERRVGAALQNRPRDEFAISTKVGRILEPSPSTADQLDDQGFAVPAATVRRWDFSRDGVLRSIEESLERTGLARFDVVYLHDPDDFWEQASTAGIGALIELREQGVVGAVGAGMNHSAPLAELIRKADVDLVMMAGEMTLLEHSALDDLLPLALERGVGVVAAGVYNSGILAKARPEAQAKFNYEDAASETIVRANQIADVCERYGVALPEAAVAYPLLHPAVVSVVLGARDAAQVSSNVQRYSATIPSELWAELHSLGFIPHLITAES
ncbi:aldo/keto reductase [Parafrigoribacterium soli]|uniref:aldo/keto reductase n=1 Tax=Parafrigoribacterium soli TaxID=3144663 RepID=UPI0032EF6826